MPQIISIVGKSGSGKTTLLTGLVTEFKRRGLRVAVIKHSHHDFKLDTQGKDTWRLAQAGSELVAFSSPQTVAYLRKMDKEASLEEISQLVGEDFDIVLTEGYDKGHCPKIEVHRSQQGTDLISSVEDLIAVASDQPLDISQPRYALDDFKGLADLIESHVQANLNDIAVSLFIDGKCIPVGPFPREIISRTLRGMVSALKGVSEANKVDLSIRMNVIK